MQRFLAAQERRIAQLTQTRRPAPPGMWRRLFGAAEEAPSTVAETPGRVPPPEPLAVTTLQESSQATQSALQAWLQGIELVRQRFVALLATEEIQMIDALHRPLTHGCMWPWRRPYTPTWNPTGWWRCCAKATASATTSCATPRLSWRSDRFRRPASDSDTISPTSTYEDVSGEREENGN